MLTGFQSGISGIYYNEQKLGVVANNLANVNTTGFRNSYLLFRSREENQGTRRIDSDVRARLPNTYGIDRQGVHRNFQRTGALIQTGNPLDVAIPSELSNAYFAVRRLGTNDPEAYYTRNGSLSFGPENPQNPNSPTVLYIAGHMALGPDGQPINIDPSAGQVSINNSGTIYQNGTSIGEIAVYRLNDSANPNVQQDADLTALIGVGDSLFRIPPAGRDQFFPLQIRVGEAGVNRLVQQGTLERSNVRVFEELQEMMMATKGAEANQVSLERQLDGLNKLFQIVRR